MINISWSDLEDIYWVLAEVLFYIWKKFKIQIKADYNTNETIFLVLKISPTCTRDKKFEAILNFFKNILMEQ